MAFEARVLTNARSSSCASRSLAWAWFWRARTSCGPYIERGEFVTVLEDFSDPFPGFYLYYPARRQASPALCALIDYLLQLTQAR